MNLAQRLGDLQLRAGLYDEPGMHEPSTTRAPRQTIGSRGRYIARQSRPSHASKVRAALRRLPPEQDEAGHSVKDIAARVPELTSVQVGVVLCTAPGIIATGEPGQGRRHSQSARRFRIDRSYPEHL